MICTKCNKVFTRKDNLKRHEQNCGINNKNHCCLECSKSYSRAHDLNRHIEDKHKKHVIRESLESPPQTFETVSEDQKITKKFNLTTRRIVFKFTSAPAGKDPLVWLKSGISDVVQHVVEGVEPNDEIGMTFSCESFKKGCGYMSFRKAKTVTMETVWKVLGKIFQSNSEGLNTDTFRITVSHVKMPRGRGKVPGTYFTDFEEECTKRRGIVTIRNDDNLCLPRAIVVAKAYVKKSSDLRKIRCNTNKIQDHKTRRLLEKTNIRIPEEGASIDELQKFQDYMKKYKITVYEYRSRGRKPIFEGSDSPYRINLLYHNKHFNVITSLTAAFSCGYYCEQCHEPYNAKGKHRCIGTCPCCQKTPPCEKTAENIKCRDCNRNFRNEKCFTNHKESLCGLISQCKNCLRTVKTNREHVCDEIFCKICAKYQPKGHLCFMQPDKRTPKKDGVLFIFFDLETTQERKLNEETRLHEPNLCVIRQTCSVCLKDEINEVKVCYKCGVRQIILKDEPVEMFMKFVLNQKKLFKTVVCIAHNGQAFDHQFLLKFVVEKASHLKPNLILRGTKIILMEINNIKFIDSINYLPMALSKLPKAFDLPHDVNKGYFPHLFNTKENKNYKGSLPDPKYYLSETMMPNDRKAFLNWYETHRLDVFDMKKEIVEYCVSDVDILQKACMKFREIFLEVCGVCPFTEAVTIASACHLTYRRNFLKPNIIGIIPKLGYRWAENQSEIAIKWLLWVEHQNNIDIRHAAKQKEAIVKGVKVDGFCEETCQIFEFHGCYYHGHDLCLTYRRDEPLLEDSCDTLNQRLERTKAKIQRLKSFGYDVIEMWECEFRKLLQEDKTIENFIKEHPLLDRTPLNPRDAFYGGRTGNTKTYYKVKEGEKIKYVDVCSLYPFICKYGKFPIGHPKVFVGNTCESLNLDEIDGVIKCSILPPYDLYHPILPSKMNDKLMFVLCRTCGENQNSNSCTHSIEERVLKGVWIIDEVLKAVKEGYKILNIWEIWQYETEQYDSLTKTGGLFSEMMNKFIKIKQQASGWPARCVTKEEKEQYIQEFFQREGIALEFDEISKNEGLRSLAKLMLNSLWGKFGQKQNQPKTSIISDSKEFYQILSNPCLTVTHIQEINEDTLVVNWLNKEEAYDPLSTVNVVLASYVTTQARLKLYSYLEQLGERVLYYDTDSVIFISRPGLPDLPTGDFLGDLTDELQEYGSNSYITEFASGGPKNYSYKVRCPLTNDEHVVCKVKGIRINYATSKTINFETIKEMILTSDISGNTKPVIISGENIRRTKDFEVVSRKESKIYRINATKRKFLDNYDSVPYGYIPKKIEKFQ